MQRRLSPALLALVALAALVGCGKSSSSTSSKPAASSDASAATAAPSTHGPFALKQSVCTLIPLATTNAALGTTYAEQGQSSSDLSCHYVTKSSGESASIVVQRYFNDGMSDWKAALAGVGTPQTVSIGDEGQIADRPDLGDTVCIAHNSAMQMKLDASKDGGGIDASTLTNACRSFFNAIAAAV